MSQRSRIMGIGMAVPSRVVTNHDLAAKMETSHEWIVERTGIRARHFAAADVACSDLAVAAARRALEAADVDAAAALAAAAGDEKKSLADAADAAAAPPPPRSTSISPSPSSRS